MRSTLGTALLAGLLLLASSAGCQQKQLVKEKPVSDPLFTSKKPIEGSPHHASDIRPGDAMPLPPPPPTVVPRAPVDPTRLASQR